MKTINNKYQKKYPHIISISNISLNKLPNCHPNYIPHYQNLLTCLESYFKKNKFRKLKTKKYGIQKEDIDTNKIKNIGKEKNKRLLYNEKVKKGKINELNNNNESDNNILKDISFETIDDDFNNDIEFEQFQIFFNSKNQNRRTKKDKEIKDVINLIQNIPDEKLIKKTPIPNKKLNSASYIKLKLKNISSPVPQKISFLKNNTDKKSKKIGLYLKKEKINTKNIKSPLNIKTKYLNSEMSLFGSERHIFKSKDKFLKGIEENMKKKIYKKRLFNKINNTYRILELFVTRNNGNNFKKNNIFPMIANTSNNKNKNTSFRSVLNSKNDDIHNIILKNKKLNILKSNDYNKSVNIFCSNEKIKNN